MHKFFIVPIRLIFDSCDDESLEIMGIPDNGVLRIELVKSRHELSYVLYAYPQ